MSLFDFLGKLVREDATHNTQIRVDPRHVTIPGRPAISPEAERHYVRIWLSEMFLRENSKWFTQRYPLTYSLVALDYANQASKEFSNVSGKNRLDIKQTNLGRSLLLNYPLTPLLPFRGGTIAIDCGLVSMEASNAITKFAGVVSEFAGKLGGAQVSAVADLAGPIAASVQDLLGAGKAVSKLYYHNVFSAGGGGTPLTSGYILLSELQEGKLEASKLWVTNDGIRTGPNATELAPLPAHDYLLLQVECTGERDDYRSFSYISEPFNDALEAKSDGDDSKAKILLTQAKSAVRKSPDFTDADRKRIRLAIDRAFAEESSVIQPESFAIKPQGPAPTRLELAIMALPLEAAAELDDPGDD